MEGIGLSPSPGCVSYRSLLRAAFPFISHKCKSKNAKWLLLLLSEAINLLTLIVFLGFEKFSVFKFRT